MAFDVLAIDGEDLTAQPLITRKRQLWALIPKRAWRLRYADHVLQRGCALFELACAEDLEGVVGKWQHQRRRSSGRRARAAATKNLPRACNRLFIAIGCTNMDKCSTLQDTRT